MKITVFVFERRACVYFISHALRWDDDVDVVYV